MATEIRFQPRKRRTCVVFPWPNGQWSCVMVYRNGQGSEETFQTKEFATANGESYGCKPRVLEKRPIMPFDRVTGIYMGRRIKTYKEIEKAKWMKLATI